MRPDEQKSQGWPVTRQRSQVLLQSRGVLRPAAGSVIKRGDVLQCHFWCSDKPFDTTSVLCHPTCPASALKNRYPGKGLITRVTRLTKGLLTTDSGEAPALRGQGGLISEQRRGCFGGC